LIPENLSYCGPFKVTDTDKRLPINIGKAVLSPTRTYAPVIKAVLDEMRDKVAGIIHCSGGGQTKCIKFGENVHYIKDNLFEIPPLFEIIKEVSKTEYKEMYQVFNMGHRMEIYTDEKSAEKIISISKSFGVDAQIIGHIEKSEKNKVTVFSPEGKIEY
jgi:phosphoribosylformylglycinamidine cyclo-ligase